MRILNCLFVLLVFAASLLDPCLAESAVPPPLLAQSAPAGDEQSSSGEEKIEPEKIILGIAGGLAVFVFGVEQLARALKAVSGNRMKRLLARFPTNPLAGLGTGTVWWRRRK
jgi:hypothetical protein